MNYKIVADSSSDVLALDSVPFANVPLVIHAGEKTFVDDENCDVAAMTDYMLTYKGKSSTACPGTQDWMRLVRPISILICSRRRWRIARFPVKKRSTHRADTA